MRPRLRTLALTTFAVGLATLVPPATTAPADAAANNAVVNQYRAVPGNGELVVSGRGFGHGRGMSQYGAQGAARAGLSHEKILAFYYPGTKVEQTAEEIKVLLTADTTSDVVVHPRLGLQVRDLGTKKAVTLPRNLGASLWRVTVDAKNRDVLQYRVGSSWKSWPGVTRFEGTPEFRASAPIRLLLPGGKIVSYRGALRAVRPTTGSSARDTVNVLALDAYVKGVVAKEMPASWSPEAVQAQSVAARTYGAYHLRRSANRSFHVDDTTRYQVYGGLSAEHPLSNDAVAATSREVLTHKGVPAFAEFSSSSGGWTAASTVPYQVAKQDPYDGWKGNANHTWTKKLTRAAIQKAYPQIGTLQGIRVTQRDGNGTWGGRVVKMALEGSKGKQWLTGDQFRSKFGTKSSWLNF